MELARRPTAASFSLWMRAASAFFWCGDLQDDGGDGLDDAVGVVDGGVADVPVAMLAGACGEFAFKEEVSDGMAFGDLLEESPGCP